MTASACAGCGGPVPYLGRGRPSTTCSPECRRAVRADAARSRRETDAPSPDAAPPIPERIRDGLAASAAERASAHEDRLKGIEDAESLFAAHDDDGGVSPSLGALGYARVSSGRDGRTIWDSDPAQKHRASYASREATRIREECVRESIRHALSAARRLGVFDPADVDLGPAREAGNERADAILAALAA